MQLDKIDFSNGMWRGLLTAEESGPPHHSALN